jgi:hypothetical protein
MRFRANYQSKGVNVAVFNDWPPDEFVENGELKGWSVDMAKAMSPIRARARSICHHSVRSSAPFDSSWAGGSGVMVRGSPRA